MVVSELGSVTRVRGQKERKLIDIGLCRFHRILKFFIGRLLKDIGRSEVANPRQSTSDTKVEGLPLPGKSRIALIYAFGFYPGCRSSRFSGWEKPLFLLRSFPVQIRYPVYSEIV